MFTTVYFSLDEETSEVTARLFHGDVAKVVEMQKQDGGKDCGLFAIAISTAIAYGVDPISLHFNQAAMRNHLCISSSSPNRKGRPLFFSGSCFTETSSLPSLRFFLISNVYAFLHVRTLLSLTA